MNDVQRLIQVDIPETRLEKTDLLAEGVCRAGEDAAVELGGFPISNAVIIDDKQRRCTRISLEKAG